MSSIQRASHLVLAPSHLTRITRPTIQNLFTSPSTRTLTTSTLKNSDSTPTISSSSISPSNVHPSTRIKASKGSKEVRQILMNHPPRMYYDPHPVVPPPRRGYWSKLTRTDLLTMKTREEYVEWFRQNVWFADGGLRNWSKKYTVLDDAWDPLGTILIEWKSLEFLKNAHKIIRSQNNSNRLWNVEIVADLWPIQDPNTTTMRISGLNVYDDFEKIKKEFEYLPNPELFYIVQGQHRHGNLGDRRYAIWDCGTNENLQMMANRGSTSTRTRATWRYRPSCNISKVELEMRREVGEVEGDEIEMLKERIKEVQGFNGLVVKHVRSVEIEKEKTLLRGLKVGEREGEEEKA